MLSTEQERQAAAATVERLISTGMPFDAAAAVARKVLGDVLARSSPRRTPAVT